MDNIHMYSLSLPHCRDEFFFIFFVCSLVSRSVVHTVSTEASSSSSSMRGSHRRFSCWRTERTWLSLRLRCGQDFVCELDWFWCRRLLLMTTTTTPCLCCCNRRRRRRLPNNLEPKKKPLFLGVVLVVGMVSISSTHWFGPEYIKDIAFFCDLMMKPPHPFHEVLILF